MFLNVRLFGGLVRYCYVCDALNADGSQIGWLQIFL